MVVFTNEGYMVVPATDRIKFGMSVKLFNNCKETMDSFDHEY